MPWLLSIAAHQQSGGFHQCSEEIRFIVHFNRIENLCVDILKRCFMYVRMLVASYGWSKVCVSALFIRFGISVISFASDHNFLKDFVKVNWFLPLWFLKFLTQSKGMKKQPVLEYYPVQLTLKFLVQASQAIQVRT